MSYKVNYANNNLHDYMTILNVKRSVLPTRNNFSKDIPSVNGEYYVGYKYTPRHITLECVVFADSREEFMENIEQLAFYLDVKAPSKLQIEDTPDRYCYAILDGSLDIEKIKHNGKFELEFTCYDPYYYANETSMCEIENKNSIHIHNDATAPSFPIINVEFKNDAYFASFSVGSKVVLVGAPYSVDEVVAPSDPIVLNDECLTLQGWNPVGNIVDNAIVNGNLSINAGGYAIYCNNYGSATSNEQSKWHGGGARKNLSRKLKDFEVCVSFEHNSLGDVKGVGSGSEPPVTSSSSSVQYKVTGDPSLRIRQNRGTSYKKLGSIPKGKVINVSNIDKNWGYTTYNGVSGYVSMDYLVKYTQPSTTSQNGSYSTTDNLRLRSGRGTNYKTLTTIPKGKSISISDVSNGWGKTSYSGKNGYVSMQYVKKNNSKSRATEEVPSAENKLGQLQVLGYDMNGVRLFCAKMIDAEKWYEYSEPQFYIGSKLVLDDGKKCPTPKTKENKDDDGKVISVEDTHSGKYGDFNDCNGTFKITRRTVNGKQQWNCEILKLGSNQVVAQRLVSNTLVDNSFPSGDLANIVIFFGQYENEPVVDTMIVKNIVVTDLSNPQPQEVRKPIFRANDKLLVDVARQKVYKNGELFMTDLDIGSEFFTIPTGNSIMSVRSDDRDFDIEVGIKKRWL